MQWSEMTKELNRNLTKTNKQLTKLNGDSHDSHSSRPEEHKMVFNLGAV